MTGDKKARNGNDTMPDQAQRDAGESGYVHATPLGSWRTASGQPMTDREAQAYVNRRAAQDARARKGSAANPSRKKSR